MFAARQRENEEENSENFIENKAICMEFVYHYKFKSKKTFNQCLFHSNFIFRKIKTKEYKMRVKLTKTLTNINLEKKLLWFDYLISAFPFWFKEA